MVEEGGLPVARPAGDDLFAFFGVAVHHVEARDDLGGRVLIEERDQLGAKGLDLGTEGESHRSAQPSTGGKNGGTPGSDFANRSARFSAREAMVHGLSSATSVIGRHPRTIWATPPWIFST